LKRRAELAPLFANWLELAEPHFDRGIAGLASRGICWKSIDENA